MTNYDHPKMPLPFGKSGPAPNYYMVYWASTSPIPKWNLGIHTAKIENFNIIIADTSQKIKQ